jgi:hypothetical protein
MNSIQIDRQDIRNYNWGERLPAHTIQYADVINFERSSTKVNRCCVLCGEKEGEKDGCLIPKQNKGVCRKCDSTYWLLKKLGVVVKFCKGCKLFFSLVDFDGKPNTTKCGTCRKRGRDNYHGKMERKRHLEEVSGCYTNSCGNGSESDTTVEDDDDDSVKGYNSAKKRRVSTSRSHVGRWDERVGTYTPMTASEDNVVAILLGMDSLRAKEREVSGSLHAGKSAPPPSVSGPSSVFSASGKESAGNGSFNDFIVTAEDEAVSLLLAAAGVMRT